MSKNTVNLNIFPYNSKRYFKIRYEQKTRNSKIVTLRAPKHFKVGRHHYQVLSRQFCFKIFNRSNITQLLELKNIYKFFLYTKKNISSLNLLKPLAYRKNTKITLSVSEVFSLISGCNLVI